MRSDRIVQALKNLGYSSVEKPRRYGAVCCLAGGLIRSNMYAYEAFSYTPDIRLKKRKTLPPESQSFLGIGRIRTKDEIFELLQECDLHTLSLIIIVSLLWHMSDD